MEDLKTKLISGNSSQAALNQATSKPAAKSNDISPELLAELKSILKSNELETKKILSKAAKTAVILEKSSKIIPPVTSKHVTADTSIKQSNYSLMSVCIAACTGVIAAIMFSSFIDDRHTVAIKHH